MPKAARTSRWIQFTVDISVALGLSDYLKRSKCCCSQWVTIDDVIKGYMFFQSNIPIPKKKQWIPGAVVSLSTQDDLLKLYGSVSYDSWHNYGSNHLFNPVITSKDIHLDMERRGYLIDIYRPLKPKPVLDDDTQFFDINDYYDDTQDIGGLNYPPYDLKGILYPGYWYKLLSTPGSDVKSYQDSLEPHELVVFQQFVTSFLTTINISSD